MKNIYLFFAILGAIVPYVFFSQFMLQNGGNLAEFIRQLFATSPASGFTSDLLITSTVFWIWSYTESRSREMRHWWIYLVLNLTIGLSCALPLFLYMREKASANSRCETRQKSRHAELTHA